MVGFSPTIVSNEWPFGRGRIILRGRTITMGQLTTYIQVLGCQSWQISRFRLGFCPHLTPVKTNISPEKWWLEDAFPIELVPLGTFVCFRWCKMWSSWWCWLEILGGKWYCMSYWKAMEKWTRIEDVRISCWKWGYSIAILGCQRVLY